MESFPHRFLTYLLTLILNTKTSSNMGYFRHIPLVGSLYKLMVKVLVERLLINSSRLINYFLKEIILVYRVVSMNESVDISMKTIKNLPILKVDFEKAYDLAS